MHHDDMNDRWAQTQHDGMAVLAYLTGEPDHEATAVMVSGVMVNGVPGDEPGVVIPGSATVEHGFPQVTVLLPDDDGTITVHAARVAPFTMIRYQHHPEYDNHPPDNYTVLCAECQP